MGKSCSQSESALYLLDDTSLLVASFAELSVTGRKASFQPELNDEDTSSNISASAQAQADFENYGHTDYFEVEFDNIFDYDLSDLLDFDEDQQHYLTTALQLEGYEEIALWVKVDIGKAKTVYKQLERELGGANEIAEIDWDGWSSDDPIEKMAKTFEAWSLPEIYQQHPVLSSFSPSEWALKYLE
jgi:hypothetical protein